MADALILKTAEQPTIFNKGMVVGGLMFLTVAPIVSTGLAGLIAPAICAVIGGMIGKNIMEHEKNEGKPVHEKPSFWNVDTAVGAAIGHVLGSVGFAAILSTCAPVIWRAAVTHTMGTITSTVAAAAAPALLGATALAIGAVVLGTYLGGKAGQAREAHEYEMAKQQAMEHGTGRDIAYTAEVVQPTRSTGKSWTQDISQRPYSEVSQQLH